MDTFLLYPSDTPHRIAKITEKPGRLKDLDLAPSGTCDKIYILQPTGGAVRYTLNPGDGPVAGARGFILKDLDKVLFCHNEIVEAQWVSESGKPVLMQVGTGTDRAMR